MSKKYISVSPHELTVGQPLPWAVYLQTGELLAPAGFMVADTAIRDRMLAIRPVRVARDNEGGAVLQTDTFHRSGAAGGGKDPLKYLKHNAEGVVLVFKLPSDFEPRTVSVDFFGRIPHQSLIVSAPPLGLGYGQTWQNFEGLPVAVQVIFGRSVCVFNTVVLRYAQLPSAHLFLRYPQDAAVKPFRAALRVEAQIPASVTLPEGYTVPALITDLSGSGCGIATGFLLGEPGVRLRVSFRVRSAEKYRLLNVPCEIKSIKGKMSQQMRYGIQFDETVDDDVLLALKSYVYEHLAE